MYLTKRRRGYKILLAMFSDPGKTLLALTCCCHHPRFSGKVSHKPGKSAGNCSCNFS